MDSFASLSVILTPVVIKVFFAVLVLCTAAIAAVCLAIHFRVKRHLSQEQMEAQVRAVIEDAAQTTSEQQKVQ